VKDRCVVDKSGNETQPEPILRTLSLERYEKRDKRYPTEKMEPEPRKRQRAKHARETGAKIAPFSWFIHYILK